MTRFRALRAAIVCAALAAFPAHSNAGSLSAPVKTIKLPGTIVIAGDGGTPGREIRLPLCTWEDVPESFACDDASNFPFPGDPCVEDADTGLPVSPSFLLQPAETNDADMLFADGNAVYGVGWALCETVEPFEIGDRSVLVTVPRGSGTFVLAHVTGYVENAEDPARVRGTVRMNWAGSGGKAWKPSVGDVEVALQMLDGDGVFRDAPGLVVRGVPRSGDYVYEVEGFVGPIADVRFEVRVRQRSTSTITFNVSDVRLFGAQCFPDLINPGMCLE